MQNYRIGLFDYSSKYIANIPFFSLYSMFMFDVYVIDDTTRDRPLFHHLKKWIFWISLVLNSTDFAKEAQASFRVCSKKISASQRGFRIRGIKVKDKR